MAAIETGSSSVGVANVDTNFNVQVNLPGNTAAGVAQGGGAAAAGDVAAFSEVDAGTITGARDVRSGEVSSDYRQRVGIDTILFNDVFNYTAQNTNNWNYIFNTLTASLPGSGTLNFGTVQGTTSAHGALLKTSQYFPVVGTAPIYAEFTVGQFTAALVSNEVFLMGFGIPTAATTPPTDGVWFQITSSGILGEIMYNGTPTQTGVLEILSALTLGSMYKFTITCAEREVIFWINDIKYGSLVIPAGNGQPFLQGSLPVFMMKYNTGAVSNTNTMRISDVCVSIADIASSKPWNHALAGAGQSAYVGQSGFTQGSTAKMDNAILASTAAGSNTAANAAGLGGIGLMTAQVSNVAAAGDNLATSYQNPASTINITGRNLYITGVKISAMNQGAAVATTPTTLLWGLAFGHTSVSLATAETGSFATATTRAPRRIPLGFQTAPIAAVVGATYTNDIVQTFATPIVVYPGEFIATTVRFIVGTATASQVVVYTVTFDGYFE